MTLHEIARITKECAEAAGVAIKEPTVEKGAVWIGEGWNVVIDTFGTIILRRGPTQEIGFSEVGVKTAIAYMVVQIAQNRAYQWKYQKESHGTTKEG
ncbi:MAG TPA: hypothetical protein PKD78_13120 [Saprospiraceae bacterium]|nr:hypothetical protein [Saprospiraceae bacterium]